MVRGKGEDEENPFLARYWNQSSQKRGEVGGGGFFGNRSDSGASHVSDKED